MAVGRPVVVGEADPPCGVPMMGRSGLFLARLCGLSLGEFLARFECVNLLRRDGRREGKGRRFAWPERRAAIASAAALDLRGRRVVLLGGRVASAFFVRRFAWFEPVHLGRGEAAAWVVPHPSGIVRNWNCPAARTAGSELLLGLLARSEGEKKNPGGSGRGR